MKQKFLSWFASLGLILVGCTDDNDITEHQMPVIEGYMVSGQFPVVLFSSSVIPSDEGSISDALISWGKVTISDGEKETILTGKEDHSYLPPYVYYTQEYRCLPGKRYILKAEYRNLHASAECTVPFPTPIDALSVSPTENDTLFAVTLHFTAPDDVPAFYYVSIRGTQRGDIAKMCPMSTLRADVPGKKYSIAIMRPKISISGETYVPNFTLGEEFTVALNRVENDVFNFWLQYDNLLLTSHSPFISSDLTLKGNVIGGYGVFSGQGSDSRYLRVEYP